MSGGTDADLQALAAIGRGLKDRRRRAFRGSLVTWLIVAALFGGAALYAAVDQGAPIAYVFAAGIALFCLWQAFAETGAEVSQETRRTAMPILARMAGLDYDRTLPVPDAVKEAGVLPAGSALTRDAITGEMDGLPFRAWQFWVRDTRYDAKGRTRTVTAFFGLLVEVPAPGAPDLIADRQGLMERFKDGMDGRPSRRIDVGGQRLACRFDEERIAPETVEGSLRTLMEGLPEGAELEAVIQTDGTAWIVVETKRDLFRFDGLFGSAETLPDEARAALADLAVPARIGTAWLATPAARPA